MDAYLDYLSRTSEQTDIKAMTDNELREYLLTNIRSYNNEKNTAMNMASNLSIITVFAGLMIASALEKWAPLIFLSILGAGLYQFIVWVTKKDRRERYRAKGLDPNRLNINQ